MGVRRVPTFIRFFLRCPEGNSTIGHIASWRGVICGIWMKETHKLLLNWLSTDSCLQSGICSEVFFFHFRLGLLDSCTKQLSWTPSGQRMEGKHVMKPKEMLTAWHPLIRRHGATKRADLITCYLQNMLYILTDWRKRLQTATFNIGLYRKPHVNAGQTKERTDRQTDMRISTMKPECATVFRWRRKTSYQ